MNIFQVLVDGYYQILMAFPAPLQWVISLLVLVGFIMAAWQLIKSNVLFLIVIALFLPVMIPILMRFFADLYRFLLFLLQQVSGGA